MYQPPQFREERRDVLFTLIRAHPLGLLVSNGEDGPVANPIPFLLDDQASENGTLLAHMSRANDQWRGLDGMPVLVVFQGANAYVTPTWYETKRETGKVVPTWNYAIVQARGRARVIEDTEWLRAQVNALTTRHEAAEAAPWQVNDAPAPFVAAQLRGIVGVTVEITSLEGKWKVSQNRPVADREGVASGLDGRADGGAMAGLVREHL
ncbi:transcriptional regulator [Acuticoccus sediminis]|uniref:Transcriptional regulator n=1 Tax=Acuticoccus sediminis TaxID=2184697 RepID=A0A8B2P5L6_9HYPH|nr:FMN-binding negative transcriptional regulator [Acuticoccus sediminis]RAI04402.1 transcriptional regulator [Acuticoccus sediminis]